MSRYIRDIKTVLFDNQRKSLPIIVYELIKCAIKDKELPLHYFNCLLYKKESGNIGNYLSNQKMQRIIQEVFYLKGKENKNFEDKLIFSKLLNAHNINTPKIFMYNINKLFILNGNKMNITSVKDFINVIQNLFNSEGIKSVFVKPIDGIGGINSFKIDLTELSDLETMSNVYTSIIQGNFLIQECLNQHEEINNIYSKSINTIRVHTFIDSDGERKIASALMRFGMNGSIVDNGSSGGLYVPVNTKDWTLKGKGRTYFKNGGKLFDLHPNSNYTFDGFNLPFPNEIEEIVLKASKLFHEEIIGWDVAITDLGPIIIEGNHNPHIVMAQVACGGFRNHVHYKRIFLNYL